MRVIIMMPVYEDWEAAFKLCRNLDGVLALHESIRAHLLFIDDGSTSAACPQELSFQPIAIEQVSTLRLHRNVGHQRAIAIALAHVREHWQSDAVVVMDSDGEDRAEDVPRLLETMIGSGGRSAVFAERGRRLENRTFRMLYRCYSFLHRLIAGRDIRFGNFSVLPWWHLDTLVLCPEMWNHYAAAFLKLRLPYLRLRCDRGHRLAGESRMNFVSLVIHGVSAILANQEVVATRLLLMTLAGCGSLLIFVAFSAAWAFETHLSVPVWLSITLAVLCVVTGQLLVGCLTLMFSIMITRSQLGFLPIRDYSYFIAQEVKLHSALSVPKTISAAAGQLI